MNREDFKILESNLIYFDNAGTSLVPSIVLDSMNDYYNNYCSNIKRGDYDISIKANDMYEKTRLLLNNFINSNDVRQIIFTSGTTDSINKLVHSYFKYYLNNDDEVLLSKSEHASNVLPWFNIDCKVKFISLDEDYKLNYENVISAVTPSTKVISLAHITNVIGDVRDIKKIIDYAHKHNILVVIDAAQSLGHTKIDVMDLDVDFLVGSAHKMLGPTGVGFIYGKYSLLEKMKPFNLGGGMNAIYDDLGNIEYSNIPYVFEAGTPNIAGIIGYGSAIEYINKIGIDSIERHVNNLRKYLVDNLSNNKNIVIYNKNSTSSIVIFNHKEVFAQDIALYLNKYNIAIRSGNHCCKILKDELGIKNTCRISLHLYNTFEEIDKLLKLLNNDNILGEII